MKRFFSLQTLATLLAALAFWLPVHLIGQDSIPNADFENWSPGGLGGYENPSGGWWASLNTLSGLGGPVTVEKTTDAFSGNLAAKLTTKQWGSLLLPGLLVSGVFDAQNPNFLVQGKPFNARPSHFTGYFKYASVGGDSAGIAALLTKWNTTTNRRDTLAEAAFVQYDNVSSWQYFNPQFDYINGDTPDSIIVALVSSFGGQNFQGQVGSTLWVDDLSLLYITSAPGISPGAEISLHSSWAGNQLRIEMSEGKSRYSLRVCNLSGMEIFQGDLQSGENQFELPVPSGVYFLQVSNAQGQVLSQKTYKCF